MAGLFSQILRSRSISHLDAHYRTRSQCGGSTYIQARRIFVRLAKPLFLLLVLRKLRVSSQATSPCRLCRHHWAVPARNNDAVCCGSSRGVLQRAGSSIAPPLFVCMTRPGRSAGAPAEELRPISSDQNVKTHGPVFVCVCWDAFAYIQ